MEVFALIFLSVVLLLTEISSLKYLSKFNSSEDTFELQVLDKQTTKERLVRNGEQRVVISSDIEVLNLTTGKHEQIRAGVTGYKVGNTYNVIKVGNNYYRKVDFIIPMILAPIACGFIGFIVVLSMQV